MKYFTVFYLLFLLQGVSAQILPENVYSQGKALLHTQPDSSLTLAEKIMEYSYPDSLKDYLKGLDLKISALGKLGKYQAALAANQRYGDTLGKYDLAQDDRFFIHTYYWNKASALTELDQLKDAVAVLEKLEQSYDSIYPQKGINHANLYTKKSQCLYGMGKQSRAISYSLKAVNVVESLDNPEPSNQIRFYNNLAVQYVESSKYHKGIRWYKEAISLMQQYYPPAHPRRGILLLNSALVYMEWGKYDRAEQQMLQALSILQKSYGPEHPHVALVKQNLGQNFWYAGEWSNAVNYFDQAIESFKKLSGDKSVNLSQAFNLRGEVHRDALDLDQAVRDYKMGLCANSPDCSRWNDLDTASIPSSFLGYKNHQAALSGLAKVSHQRGDLAKAARYWEKLYDFIGTREKQLFDKADLQELAAQKINMVNQALPTEYALYQSDSASYDARRLLRYLEGKKHNLMRSVQRRRSVLERLIPDSTVDRLVSLKKEIEELRVAVYEGSDSLQARQIEIERLARMESHDSILEAAARPGSKDLWTAYKTPQEPSKEVRLAITELHQAGTVPLYYTLTDSVFYSVLFKPGELVFLQHSGSTPMLQKMVHDLRRHIQHRQKVDSLGQAIAQILWGPLVKELNSETVLVIPENFLNFLPFEALPHPSRDNYLLQEHMLYYAPSLSFWQKGFNKPKDQSWPLRLASFAPHFDSASGLIAQRGEDTLRSALGSLPNAAVEARTVSDMLRGESYLGAQATEQKFYQQGGQAQVLHLATHSILDDRSPLLNRIYLHPDTGAQDGAVHIYELYNQELGAELAVLSACNTGFGPIQQGEGVISMAQGFQFAGVPNVVMTRWKVDDRASASIMKNFYRHLKQGQGKAAALQKAKIDYLRDAREEAAHPFYWSGFMLMGNNSPLASEATSLWAWLAGALLLILALAFYFIKGRRSS